MALSFTVYTAYGAQSCVLHNLQPFGEYLSTPLANDACCLLACPAWLIYADDKPNRNELLRFLRPIKAACMHMAVILTSAYQQVAELVLFRPPRKIMLSLTGLCN
eukprot:346254-Pelagomonas_calceolata.AAC.11